DEDADGIGLARQLHRGGQEQEDAAGGEEVDRVGGQRLAAAAWGGRVLWVWVAQVAHGSESVPSSCPFCSRSTWVSIVSRASSWSSASGLSLAWSPCFSGSSERVMETGK